LARKRTYAIYFNDLEVLNICVQILFRHKILNKNNFIKNDKNTPPRIIIETKLRDKELIKILNKKIKNQYYIVGN
jgi:hypothetical protein